MKVKDFVALVNEKLTKKGEKSLFRFFYQEKMKEWLQKTASRWQDVEIDLILLFEINQLFIDVFQSEEGRRHDPKCKYTIAVATALRSTIGEVEETLPQSQLEALNACLLEEGLLQEVEGPDGKKQQVLTPEALEIMREGQRCRQDYNSWWKGTCN